MNPYTVTSPVTGLPDYTVNLPTKQMRLTLEPSEALALYVMLEQSVTVLNKSNAPESLVDILTGIADKLHDRLEVTFHEHP